MLLNKVYLFGLLISGLVVGTYADIQIRRVPENFPAKKFDEVDDSCASGINERLGNALHSGHSFSLDAECAICCAGKTNYFVVRRDECRCVNAGPGTFDTIPKIGDNEIFDVAIRATIQMRRIEVTFLERFDKVEDQCADEMHNRLNRAKFYIAINTECARCCAGKTKYFIVYMADCLCVNARPKVEIPELGDNQIFDIPTGTTIQMRRIEATFEDDFDKVEDECADGIPDRLHTAGIHGHFFAINTECAICCAGKTDYFIVNFPQCSCVNAKPGIEIPEIGDHQIFVVSQGPSATGTTI